MVKVRTLELILGLTFSLCFSFLLILKSLPCTVHKAGLRPSGRLLGGVWSWSGSALGQLGSPGKTRSPWRSYCNGYSWSSRSERQLPESCREEKKHFNHLNKCVQVIKMIIWHTVDRARASLSLTAAPEPRGTAHTCPWACRVSIAKPQSWVTSLKSSGVKKV